MKIPSEYGSTFVKKGNNDSFSKSDTDTFSPSYEESGLSKLRRKGIKIIS